MLKGLLRHLTVYRGMIELKTLNPINPSLEPQGLEIRAFTVSGGGSEFRIVVLLIAGCSFCPKRVSPIGGGRFLTKVRAGYNYRVYAVGFGDLGVWRLVPKASEAHRVITAAH